MTGTYSLFDSPVNLTCTGWMRTCQERLGCGTTETLRLRNDFIISFTGRLFVTMRRVAYAILSRDGVMKEESQISAVSLKKWVAVIIQFSNRLRRSLPRRQSSTRTGKQRGRVHPGSQVNKLLTGYLCVLLYYCLLSRAD